MAEIENTLVGQPASDYLLALARKIAIPYQELPNTKAIIVTGSVAEGSSDAYSDIDLILYYDRLPAEETLLAVAEQNRGEHRRAFGKRTDDEFGDAYYVSGVQCQVAHSTIAAWERDIATILEQLEVKSPLQKTLSGMLKAIPIYGEALVREWQERLSHYPDALAQAMVTNHLGFFPLWAIQRQLASRDATVWIYQMLVETAHNFFGIMAGLNRLYYSSFQFKRMRLLCEKMHIAPVNLADRVESLFHSDPVQAALDVEILLKETLDLIDQHMPEVTTAAVRASLGRRNKRWTSLAEK